MRTPGYVNTAAAGLLAAAAAACASAARHTPDDTAVVVIESPMLSSDPRRGATNYDGKLAHLVFEGLTAVDTPTMVPRLGLAARIDRIDDLTIDVTLRDDVKFSDGSPVTAADVVGTYMSVLAPDWPTAHHKTLTDRFTSVEATSRLVARFHLVAPLATFMTDVDFGIVSFHDGPPARDRVIGAGAYRLRELTSTGAVLEPNPHYYGGAPRIGRVEFKFVPDSSARLLMLAGGSADLIPNSTRLDLVAAIGARPGVQVLKRHGAILTYLMMNNDDPVLADRRVRHAIALALDRPAIIAAKLGGLAVEATGLLSPDHWAYNAGVPRWDHDPARARRLLAEAGVRDLHLVYKTSSDAFRVAIARTIAAQLAEVGITVEVRSFEFATFFADVKRGAYQLASMQTADITEPDFYFMYFHSSWIPAAPKFDGFNRWRYRSAEIDRLTLAGRRELDVAARRRIYDEVQRKVADDLPIIPLWHEDNVVLASTAIHGYTMTPNGRLTGLRDITKQQR
jgi:peptide/nickel transport system substrate-binding protein